MKTTVVLASLLVTTLAAAHAAHADGELSPTRYVQTDVMIGGSAPVAGPNLLGAVSGGYLATSNIWLRGELAGGPAADDQGGGSNIQARAGVETRACASRRIVCAVFGLDAGVLHGTWIGHDSTMQEHVTAAMVVPRLGIDAGGRQLRARVGIELDEAVAGTHSSTYAPSTPTSGTIGGELAAGLAYQW